MRKVLTIAGSDSVGGAGVQADLKTFQALGVYGGSVVTAVTAQNTYGVRDVFVLPAYFVAEQLDAVFADVPWDAVKIGMLGTAEVAKIVAEKIKGVGVPVVLDPVMASREGHILLEPAGRQVLLEILLPLVTVITPNALEAEAILGRPVRDVRQAKDAAMDLVKLGARGVVLKGGHLKEDPGICTDVVCDGLTVQEIRGVRLEIGELHGTGCTFSSVMSVGLAHGLSVIESARLAKEFLEVAIQNAYQLSPGLKYRVLNHAAAGMSSRVRNILGYAVLRT